MPHGETQDSVSASARQRIADNTPSSTLRLFNTLTRTVEPIIPVEPDHVRMYSCGPTVYRFIHIGNLRTFTMADWIRRTLTYLGYQVTHIKNITDVGHMRQEVLDRGEDKMIAQARREGKTPWEIARFYTEAFLDDERKLHILPAHVFPRATDHIAEMIAMTQQLLANGHAYEAGGNVFFAVKSFPAYGQLSGNILDYLGQGQHVESETDPYKRAPEDFPLWKLAEPGRVMAWESPWGLGFPGWHIECSAMSTKYLGQQIDIHTGGVDNIFPHHEDERAQSEAASGERFVRCWVHAQHLLADGLKMAKSTGNSYTLADVEARGFEPLALRCFFTTALYRSRINFTFRALQAAETSLLRLREHACRLWAESKGQQADAKEYKAHPYHADFVAAVTNDLNIPRALAVVWKTVRDKHITAALRLALLLDFDTILGLDLAGTVECYAAEHTEEQKKKGRVWSLEQVPAEVLSQASARATLRRKGDYQAADALRERIHTAGFEVRDGREETQLVHRREHEQLISRPADVPAQLDQPARYTFSVNLLAHNNRADLERCLKSVVRHAEGQSIEVVILDNGSTDDTLNYLKTPYRQGEMDGVPLRIIFADHNMGFAAGRNASFRASLGKIILVLDTSIEVNGDIWTPLAETLATPTIGLAGPYGLVTRDLKEFEESVGPDVDAIEGYLMAFRRETLLEVGPTVEKFRFYRLMDVDYSFEFKRAGYRVVTNEVVAGRLIKHPHSEWYSLSPDEQQTKSKKNFDIFYKRRHHSQSLLVANYRPGQAAPWGHNHELSGDYDPRFEHESLGATVVHSHEHKHWPDHAHNHQHTHESGPRCYDEAEQARYVSGETTN